MEIQTDAPLLARLILAVVFFVAGAAKLADLAGSRQAIIAFGLPKSLAPSLGLALPVGELLIAIGLISQATGRAAAIASIVLLAIFCIAIATVIIRGREAECHCFGQLHSSPVGYVTMGRTLALLLVAVVALGKRGAEPGSYVERFSSFSPSELAIFAGGVFAFAALSAAVWFMSHLLRQHGRLLLRLDSLEEQLTQRGLIGFPAVANTSDGLPVGSVAPSFTLPGIDNTSVGLDDLLRRARSVVLVFSHPGCAPCTAMLSALRSWQTDYSGTLTIALISQGSVDDNRAAHTDHGIENILLQQQRETAEEYEAYATPSAVLVSADGTIASTVIQGEAAIRLLIASSAEAVVAADNTASDNNIHDVAHARSTWHNATPATAMGLDAH